MIQPNELRIGNLIAPAKPYPPLNKTPIICDEEFLEVLFGARDYNNYFPIPLTPEILEKCGFDKDGIMKFDFQWLEVNIKREIAQMYDPTIQASSTDFPCKHLHQLQNLYFALTGEELNINL